MTGESRTGRVRLDPRPGESSEARRIGNIRLDQRLGEGGFGTVWAGFDERLEREVAVKALRAEAIDHETRARLLLEARSLSRLDHPNVCRIYDLIQDEHGVDHLVLERIRGRTLEQAMNDGISRRAKLRIAEQVAEALKAIHARDIIHRDLKPANVMLDGAGRKIRVKILDFGLARDTEPESQWPPLTATGIVVGSPLAMSPEQANADTVSTASDMYSLGLLLHELFTGRSPYEPGLSDTVVLRRAATSATLPVAGIDKHLAALIEELEAPAPEDRPAAAEAASRLRWIRAKPKRRRRRLAAAAVVAAFIAGGVKYTFDLRRERAAALAARDAAEDARREAEQVTEFMVELFEVSDPSKARGREVTAREILDRGAGRIAGELEGQPLVRARIMSTIGLVYRSLGDYDRSMDLEGQALDVRREILGDGSVEVAESLDNLGSLAYYRGRYQEAERLLERSLEIRERSLGPDHPDVATALHNLAAISSEQGDLERAEPLYRRSLAIRERTFGTDHREVVLSLGNLAVLFEHRGAPEEAEAH